MRQLVIGLLGCGRWGRYILRDLRILGCEVWVVARDAASIARAKESRAAEIVPRIEDLPERLEGYVVAVPATAHFEVTAALAPRGRPIFVEKPLALSVADVERLDALAGEQIFVMHKWRYHPGVEAIAAMVGTGTYGRALHVGIEFSGWGCNHEVDPVWVLAPHVLSIALHLLGNLPPARFASGERNARGVPVGLRAVLGDMPPVDITIESRNPRRRRYLRVAFESAVAMLDDPYADHVLVQPGDGTEAMDSEAPIEIPISTEFPLLRELRAFVAHLQGGPAPISGIESARQCVGTTCALREMAGFSPL